jgi:alpha-glucosidase
VLGLSVTEISPEVVRVRSRPEGPWRPRRSWEAVGPPERARRTVTLGDSVDELQLTTSSLRVLWAPSEGLTISRADGTVLFQDGGDGGPTFEDDPRRASWSAHLPSDRRAFGFGERTGLLDKRGRRYTCWTTDEWRQQGPTTDALYVAIPWFMALDPDGRSFGFFLDTTFRSAFDLTRLADQRFTMQADTDELDWYLIDGPDPEQVLERFTDLVGRHPMPPLWALGYHQARWSYGTEDEVRDVAAGLRRHAIPADAIHLDIDHMDRYRVFTWDRQRFPDPRGLARELRTLGLRLTAVADAAVNREPDFPVYATGSRNDFFVRSKGEELTGYLWGGSSVFPDHTRPEVRRWWGDHYQTYLRDGIAGFLNDMNEPAMHDRPIDDPATQNSEPAPDTPFGSEGERTTHAEVRNVYGLLQDQGTDAALRRARPQERPFLATRAGFAGVQRHAVVWTGDNASTWEHLEMSLPQLLNLGLSGVAIAGADIGGFFADCTPELLVRWTQLGAFYPFARNNSARETSRQEPWSWGEPTTSRCRRAIELRYRLLPYLYTVVRQASQQGWPILRPLWFHDSADPGSQGVEDEALLGRDLLIAPVLRPGKAARDVYLPPGGWYDVRSGQLCAGGRVILASATLDEDLPLFARTGSIIPFGPVVASTDAGPPDPLSVHVFPADDGSALGILYEDDGASPSYRDGDWAETRLEARREGTSTTVRASHHGMREPVERRIVVVVHAPRERHATLHAAGQWEVTL